MCMRETETERETEIERASWFTLRDGNKLELSAKHRAPESHRCGGTGLGFFIRKMNAGARRE